MGLKRTSFFAGILIALIVFASIGYILSIIKTPIYKVGNFMDFGGSLWTLRRLDVAVQVVLIFACALGILTFFAERGSK